MAKSKKVHVVGIDQDGDMADLRRGAQFGPVEDVVPLTELADRYERGEHLRTK